MDSGIRAVLEGGDPRSLGRTEEVVQWVLNDEARLPELFETLFDNDEIVRMRAGDALEKVARQQPVWLIPYVQRLLTDVAGIRQCSVQWHLAQILGEIPLSADQQRHAISLLKSILDEYDDWIVVNLTLEALAALAQRDDLLRQELPEILQRYARHPRKSIAKRSLKLLHHFEK